MCPIGCSWALWWRSFCCQVATQWPDLTNADSFWRFNTLHVGRSRLSGLTRLLIGVHWVNIAPAKSNQFSKWRVPSHSLCLLTIVTLITQYHTSLLEVAKRLGNGDAACPAWCGHESWSHCTPAPCRPSRPQQTVPFANCKALPKGNFIRLYI